MRPTQLFNSYFSFLFLIIFFSIDVYSKDYNISNYDQIHQLSLNKNGAIKIIGKNQICTFKTEKLISDCFSTEQAIHHHMDLDDDKSLICFKNNFSIFSNSTLTFSDTIKEQISCISKSKNLILLGTAGDGLFVFDRNKNEKYPIKTSANLFINDIKVSDKAIWLAHDDGILILSLDNFKVINKIDIPDKITNHVLLTAEDEILAFSEFGSIYLIDLKGNIIKSKTYQHKFTKVASSLGSYFLITQDACFEITNDLKLNLIQKGTFSSILALSNQLFLSQNNKLIEIDITQTIIKNISNCYSLYAQNDTTIWVGSKGEIILLKNNQIEKKIKLLETINPTNISAIYVHNDIIYAGTMGQGLFIYSTEGKLLKLLLQSNSDNQKNIIQIKKSDGFIWVAYLNGVLTLNPKNNEIVKDYSHLLGNNYLYCIEAINENNFFVGTSAHGLLHYLNGNTYNVLDGKSIYSINKNEQELIVCTENKGAYKIAFSNNNRLDTNYIPLIENKNIFHSVYLDKKIIFITEDKNIIYNPNNNYRIDLQNNELNEIHFNAVSTSNKFIYIGYENGILKLNKKRLGKIDEMTLVLNDPLLFEKSIPSSKTTFNYDENTLNFSYNSYNYYSNIYYKYRLIGLDSSWQLTTQDHLNYYNLPPGEYTLEIASGINNSFPTNNTVSYNFKIKNPFWKHPLFVLLCVLLIAALIYYFNPLCIII